MNNNINIDKAVCIAPKCDRLAYAKNLCKSHHNKFRRTGKISAFTKGGRKPYITIEHKELSKIYKGMKQRCYNSKNPSYSRYGGRGIVVCERWLKSLNNFVEDMGNRPSVKHSLDRIDNNGNYEPENCRWATSSEQIINRVFKGKSFDKQGIMVRHSKTKGMRYTARTYWNGKTISLGVFSTEKEAIECRLRWIIDKRGQITYTK